MFSPSHHVLAGHSNDPKLLLVVMVSQTVLVPDDLASVEEHQSGVLSNAPHSGFI